MSSSVASETEGPASKIVVGESRRLFDRLPDPTFLLDLQGRMLDVNAATEKALSRGRHQLVGATLAEVGASSAVVRRVDELFQDMLKTGAPCEGLVTGETSRGPLHWEVRLVPDADGSVIGVMRDVTEAVCKQNELSARRDDLRELRDSFCHDLRSPLATIRSFLGLLVEDIKVHDEVQIAADIGAIHEAVNRMIDLISAIGKRTPRNERTAASETSLGVVVDDAVALLAGCINARKAVVHVSDEHWMLRGDRGSFVEIFENLIENAVKFTSEGQQPRITVGVEDRHECPVIYVRDDGIGIEPEFIERAFDRCERQSPDGDGTGVGLSIVKSLVERHGGSVWIESAGRGRGTTVKLTLPGMYENCDLAG